jgi:hypothetical protein
VAARLAAHARRTISATMNSSKCRRLREPMSFAKARPARYVDPPHHSACKVEFRFRDPFHSNGFPKLEISFARPTTSADRLNSRLHNGSRSNVVKSNLKQSSNAGLNATHAHDETLRGDRRRRMLPPAQLCASPSRITNQGDRAGRRGTQLPIVPCQPVHGETAYLRRMPEH